MSCGYFRHTFEYQINITIERKSNQRDQADAQVEINAATDGKCRYVNALGEKLQTNMGTGNERTEKTLKFYKNRNQETISTVC